MASQEAKKRKACDPCTKAKAKCSPFESRADICGRCQRLNKTCVYGDSLRKRGPRTRSRMKQLEHQVETLMGMISTSDITPTRLPRVRSSATVTTSRHNEMNTSSLDGSSQPYVTPEDSPIQILVDAFSPYDPVHIGLLEEDDAVVLLDEFRTGCSQCFPFVIVDASVDVNTFRREQPFLFLSIMTAMTYRTPSTQRILAENFKEQVAARIIECSHKGLEMLQGLLVHSAYYHYIYQPGKQQLALMIQMCVATAQELGLARNCKDRDVSSSALVLSTAENRALLGTYYLAASFAQAWRKRTTVPYTRAIAHACRSFSESPEYPSDLLISPLVQLSELMCRINDYFSYDNIDESELNGDTILDLSTNNFSTERQRMQDAMSESVAQNTTVRLTGDLLDVMIYECSAYSTLWQAPLSTTPTLITQSRMSMLQRSLKASQKLARTLLGVSSTSFNHIAFPIWSGWFYSTLLVMKIVVLRQTGCTVAPRINSLPHTVGDLFPQSAGGSTTQRICSMASSLVNANLSRGNRTGEESDLVSLFQSLVDKLKAAIPRPEDADSARVAIPFLEKAAKLQEGLLVGLKKITEQQHTTSTGPALSQDSCSRENSSGASNLYESKMTPSSYQGEQLLQNQYQNSHLKSMQYDEPLNFAYFDNPAAFGDHIGQQPLVDDWLWNMVMSDNNMFTL